MSGRIIPVSSAGLRLFLGRPRLFLGAMALFGLSLAGNVNAQTLFTTVTDFNQWVNPPNVTVGSTAFDADGVTTNGIGNTTAAGGSDTAGSLSITLATPTNNFQYPAYSPGEQGNQVFLSAIDPGAVAGTSLTTYSGVLTMTYVAPTNNGGNYFQLGAVFNYDGNFGQYFGSDAAGPIIDGQQTTIATIPYTINATSLSYFQLGIIYNSNYAPTTPMYVDAISVPEPTSIGLLGTGVAMLMFRRRKTSV